MIPCYVEPERGLWKELTRRAEPRGEDVSAVVGSILARVRDRGNRALREIVREIEGWAPEDFEVEEYDIEEVEDFVSEELKEAIRTAAANIRRFHEAQRAAAVDVEVCPGVRCVQRSVPIGRVGLYVPGGTAPLFSTVLMLAIPARIAGCGEVVMCTPASHGGEIAPEVLYAARLCGVDRVFRIGGAQAIAAMAYGTETVPRVDKIFGPGNRYVTAAKQMASLAGVAIDIPAGPSEVMILAADGYALPEFAAADMLSQAEHGADSQAMLVCDSEEFAQSVRAALKKQTALLPRREIAEKALENSRIIVLSSVDDMVGFANVYAAEHLIVSMPDPWEIAARITSAGSVFIGNWSPESAGDYASGTNHTLPTAGWARSCSGVNLDSFMKKITYQELTREGLLSLAGTVTAMAEAEGLEAHAAAVKIRTDALCEKP